MEIRDILLVMTPSEVNAGRLALAQRLSAEQGARVVGACLYRRPDPPMSDMYAVGYDAVADVIDREDQRAAELVAPVALAFHETFSGADPSAIWEEPAADESPAISAARARFVDLTVVGRDPRNPGTSIALVEALVLAGGSPCLLLPEDRPPPPAFRRIIVGWNGSREAKRALDDSLVFLRQAAAVEIVVAPEAGRAVEEPELAALVSRLSRHSIRATAKRLEPGKRPQQALRRYCQETAADLLVIGAYSHSHAAEVVLGGVTRSMLRDPPLAVLASC